MYFFDVKLTLFAAGVLAVLYLLFFCTRGESHSKSLVQTLAVALLALAGLLAGVSDLLVLALSSCGDFLLSRDNQRSFLAGVGAFAAAHICYVILFVTSPLAGVANLTPPRLFIVAGLLIFGAAMIRLLYRNAGDLRFAVPAYVPVILAMGIASLTLPAGYGLVISAAFLFMLSDAVLAAELFLLGKTHPLRRLTPWLIWLCYWLAQLGFLLGYLVLTD